MSLETIDSLRASPFKFLLTDSVPKHIALALQYYGLHEVVGAGSNPKIMSMAESLNPQVVAVYKDDDMAWCAIFAGFIIKSMGDSIPASYDAMRALQYKTVGVGQSRAALGDLLVLEREGGGHVCFYVGEDAENFFVLGGNQKNMVCIVPIQKSRVSAIRRLNYIVADQPDCVKQISISFNGAVSQNES